MSSDSASGKHFARTWAVRGQRPVLERRESGRRAVSTTAALSTRGKLYRSHVEGSVRSGDIVAMLGHLRQVLPEGFILVWDHASIHRAKEVQEFLAAHPQIVVEPLPAYAPKLNPEEFAHGNIKAHLRNFLPKDKAEIRARLNREFSRLRRRPDIIMGCFHAAGLRIKQFF
ncbi:transposase [Verrucomicrobiota bacterium sgz303538]